jgi:hypothetical protein
MSLATNLLNLATRTATEFKSLRTLINGNVTDLSSLDTTYKFNLVGAINEVLAATGGTPVASLDDLTDVIITSAASGDLLSFNGTDWVNIDGDATYQPADGDLTAIAALATTSYGRALLTLANQAALMALLSAATTSAQGIVELATDTETTTGTDTTRAITPSNLAAAFLNRIDTNTALGTSNTKVPSQNAAKVYIDGIIAAANALVYEGVIDCSANPNYPAADAGQLYLVSVAGKIGGGAGQNVEAGDMLICKTDGTAAGNEATVGSSWNIIQKNIDGAVTGPTSSTSGNLASFNGTGGKVVQDAGVAVSTDGTMAGNSDALLATQKAVRTYLAANYYTQTQLGDPTTDFVATFEAGLV